MATVRVWDGAHAHAETIDLEEYLGGVLPREMASGWPAEALKAQAVGARSYAVSKMGSAGAILERDERDQVYGDARFADTTAAVRATAGEVLIRGGHVVMAFFFAHCDGATRSPAEAGWDEAVMQDGPVFRAVACPCGFTALAGHGLGMCQEGARALANGGATYRDILGHYYTGVAIAPFLGAPPPLGLDRD